MNGITIALKHEIARMEVGESIEASATLYSASTVRNYTSVIGSALGRKYRTKTMPEAGTILIYRAA